MFILEFLNQAEYQFKGFRGKWLVQLSSFFSRWYEMRLQFGALHYQYKSTPIIYLSLGTQPFDSKFKILDLVLQ